MLFFSCPSSPSPLLKAAGTWADGKPPPSPDSQAETWWRRDTFLQVTEPCKRPGRWRDLKTQVEAKQTNKIGEMGLKSKAHLSSLFFFFKPVRGAPCKEELLWGNSDTFLFSVGVSEGKTNSLLLLHQVFPPLFPTNVIFFFFLPYFRNIPAWVIVSSTESKERKLRRYWGFERYLMFQSGSEGLFLFLYGACYGEVRQTCWMA